MTALDALVAQPTVRFGISGDSDKRLVAFACTNLNAVGKRARFLPAVLEDGESSLSFGVTVGADANGMMGRAYWKGVLVENEV